MANLRDKVSNLLKTTSSKEVKAVCESFLKETENTSMQQSDKLTESLFNNLKQINANEALTMLNEMEGHVKEIRNIKMEMSKKAAAGFAENWDSIRRDKHVSNVGEHANNVMRNERATEAVQEKAILEQMSVLTQDAAAQKYVSRAQMENYGVSEAVAKIKASKISEHQQLKYVLARFENRLSQNEPEHTMVRDFVTSFQFYKWDPIVAESLRGVETILNNKGAELEVQNAIYSIKTTDRKNFFSGLVSKMDEWLNDENKSVQGLVVEMKSWMFNPQVKDLVTKLQLMENSKGTHFNIPVKGSNCSIEKIYSPVVSTEAGGQIFKAGNRFYHATADKIESLTEAQVNALPQSYLELCESFFNPAVKVVDEKVTVYVGRTKVQITGDKRTFINEKEVDASTLGSQMMYHVQQTIFRSSGNLINVATTLLENVGTICEIDYGKSIFSTLYEGAGVYLFKKGDKIFINKVNTAMNENTFLEANALQTVNFVKKFLSFNLAESLAGFLEGEFKKKAEMETELNGTLDNIKILEGQLEKVENLILEDPTYGDIDEVAQTKNLLETELNKLKSKWQNLSNEIRTFENLDEKKKVEEPKEIEVKKEEEPKDEAPKEDEPKDDAKGEEKEEGSDEKKEGDDAPKADAPEGEKVTDDTEAANVTPDGEAAPGEVAPVVAQSDTATAVVDLGLAGAAGAQPTAIQGNDHLDAGASAAQPADGSQVVNVGFVGAAGTQANAAKILGGADVLTTPAAAVPVITPGGEAQTIPGAAAPSAIPVSGEVPVVLAQDKPAADVIGDKTDEAPVDGEGKDGGDVDAAPAGKDGGEADVVAPEEGDVKENKNISEKIGVDSKVKIKESQKTGTVTAAQDNTFTVLLDDGGTADCALEGLEDLSGEIEQNIAKNELSAKPESEKKNEDEEASVEGSDNKEEKAPEEKETMFVKAVVGLDFGPFKAGEEVDVDAAGFAAAGDDSPIKLKDAKDSITEIPKKYLKVSIAAPSAEVGDAEVHTKVENAIKNLDEIETFLKGNDKISNKGIEEAIIKLREFVSLNKENNVADKAV